MNTLYIQEEEISFIGFDNLKEDIYFIFRKDSLVISRNKIDSIMPQEHKQLSNKKIKDYDLSLKLINHGFLNFHSFTQLPDGSYICPYPLT